MSLAELSRELSELSSKGPVRLAYFKTTDAETAALDAWIDAQTAAWNQGHAWQRYVLVGNNCGDYCRIGMDAATGAGRPSPKASVPNVDFWQYWLLADLTYRAATKF